MGKIDKKTVQLLKEVGGIGLKIRRNNRTKEPVFYVWQMFEFMRLDLAQARELIGEIGQEIAKHEKRAARKAAGKRLPIKLGRKRPKA